MNILDPPKFFNAFISPLSFFKENVDFLFCTFLKFYLFKNYLFTLLCTLFDLVVMCDLVVIGVNMVCGQEQRELRLTPEQNKEMRVCFALFPLRCRTNRMAAGSEAGNVGRRWCCSSRLLTPGGQRESISSLNYCRPRDAAG